MPDVTYRNFPIQVSRLDPNTRQYQVRVVGPVPGGQPGFEEQSTGTYPADFFSDSSAGRPVDLLEAIKARKITDAQLYRLGALLSDLLLPAPVRQRLVDSLQVTRERDQRLRLRLIIEAPELAALPWEFLYLKPSPSAPDSPLNFLSLLPELSIVRHEAIDAAEPRLERRTELRMVAALASPADQPALKVEEDRQAIEAMISAASGEVQVDPTWLAGATRPALVSALEAPADLFHFSGHGLFMEGEGYVLLEASQGQRTDLYSGGMLAQLLHGAGVKLAVLGACETAQRAGENLWTGVAPLLVQAGLAAVVASQFRLQDRNALPLVQKVYGGVLAGLSIDQALYNARQAIFQQSGLANRDWGAMVLYLRVEDGVIFPAPETEPAAARPVVVSLPQGAASDPADTARGLVALPAPRLLPPPLQVDLVGRAQELSQAQEQLRQAGKTYFYGAFGVGKTSLATELFHRILKEKSFEGGCLWGSLSGLDAERALEWVAARLQEPQVSAVTGRQAKIEALQAALARRPDLLIGLDEVRDSSVAQSLLAAAGSTTLILNGQGRLDLRGQAQELPLQPLDDEQAENLFISLAHPAASQAGAGTSPLSASDRELVRRIVRRLRGLPLAIKLAAFKHAEGESLETLWERLQLAPGSLLPSGDDDGLLALFQAAYQDVQKDPAALRLLVRIASFPALEAPLNILRQGEAGTRFFQAKDLLLALGLVEAAGPDRLALHPLLGLGVERVAAQELENERQKTRAWLLDYAHTNWANYPLLEREHANLAGLLEILSGEGLWPELAGLLMDLFDYLRVRGYWTEAFQRLEALLDTSAGLDDWQVAWATMQRGVLYALRSDLPSAQKDFSEAGRRFETAGDAALRGAALYQSARLSLVSGKTGQAKQQLFEALRLMKAQPTGPLARPTRDRIIAQDRAAAHERLAGILAAQGDLQSAQEHYEKALELGEPEEQARAHIALGDLARRAGDPEGAQGHFAAALQRASALGHLLQQAALQHELGYVHLDAGSAAEAEAAFKAALALYQQLDYQPGVAQALHDLGNVAYTRQDYPAAQQQYAQALDLNRKLGQDANAVANLHGLALAGLRLGQVAQAQSTFQKALEAAQKIENLPLQAASLAQLGSLAYDAGQYKEALDHLKTAAQLAAQSGELFTQAAAKYYTGLIQARQGEPAAAQETLKEAEEAFTRLHSPQAARVQRTRQALASLQPGENPETVDILLPGDAGAVQEGKAAPERSTTAGIDVLAKSGGVLGVDTDDVG